MTNYNERLDEIARDAYRGEIDWIHDQLDGTSFIGESLGVVEKNVVDTKQAITSLIKELVAEARINENNMYIRELPRHYFPSGPGEPHIPLVQFHERIAELKAEKEEEEDGYRTR